MLLSAPAQTAGAPPALPTGNTGIAASFPNDANIKHHANVLFADGFETYTSVSQLTGYRQLQQLLSRLLISPWTARYSSVVQKPSG